MLALMKTKKLQSRNLFKNYFALLGPAFVAAIAYVDPGNVATNISAGAQYGYLLVWVLVLANAMAALVQYLSAKVGLVTGKSLPEIVAEYLPKPLRILYWLQAEAVAIATDIAEVLGGAIALSILFGLPLLVGGIITGIVSLMLLATHSRRGQKPFERIIMGCLLVIALGFVAGLFVVPLHASLVLGGLIPRFAGIGSILIATGMIGATIMPHVVYLHSALARDRQGIVKDSREVKRLLRATRIDVGTAMIIAGGVNIAMLLVAASVLYGMTGVDTITGAQAAIALKLGQGIGYLFAIGLLASGLASSSVGSYAGAVIMDGLLKIRIPLFVRRVVTLLPALALLSFSIEPTQVLILSQVILSFGIPFAVIPLILVSCNRRIMGAQVNSQLVAWAASLVTVFIVILNVGLIGLTFGL